MRIFPCLCTRVHCILTLPSFVHHYMHTTIERLHVPHSIALRSMEKIRGILDLCTRPRSQWKHKSILQYRYSEFSNSWFSHSCNRNIGTVLSDFHYDSFQWVPFWPLTATETKISIYHCQVLGFRSSGVDWRTQEWEMSSAENSSNLQCPTSVRSDEWSTDSFIIACVSCGWSVCETKDRWVTVNSFKRHEYRWKDIFPITSTKIW